MALYGAVPRSPRNVAIEVRRRRDRRATPAAPHQIMPTPGAPKFSAATPYPEIVFTRMVQAAVYPLPGKQAEGP